MPVRVSEIKAPPHPLPFDLALDFNILLIQPLLPWMHITLLDGKSEMRGSFTIVRW
jgi:hypothetical protein